MSPANGPLAVTRHAGPGRKVTRSPVSAKTFRARLFGAVIAGAQVRLLGTDTGDVARELTSAEDGAFSAPLLRPCGVYAGSGGGGL